MANTPFSPRLDYMLLPMLTQRDCFHLFQLITSETHTSRARLPKSMTFELSNECLHVARLAKELICMYLTDKINAENFYDWITIE